MITVKGRAGSTVLQEEEGGAWVREEAHGITDQALVLELDRGYRVFAFSNFCVSVVFHNKKNI